MHVKFIYHNEKVTLLLNYRADIINIKTSDCLSNGGICGLCGKFNIQIKKMYQDLNLMEM